MPTAGRTGRAGNLRASRHRRFAFRKAATCSGTGSKCSTASATVALKMVFPQRVVRVAGRLWPTRQSPWPRRAIVFRRPAKQNLD